MTHYQKGILVMDYLETLNADSVEILHAICDENLEKSYRVIKENPKISKAEFLKMVPVVVD